MKNKIYLLLAVCIVFWVGCSTQKDTVIEIDEIKVTKAEFDQAFAQSRFASMKDGKKAFLESYINKKLLLLKAEKMGLDKDPDFLNQIQMFWETALLQEVLSQKSDELATLVNISEAEVRDYYQRNKDKFFAGKDLDSVRDQIKWFIIQDKQGWVMDAWLKVLKASTHIEVNYGRLGITE